jgi:hypothetical protein
MLAKCAARWPRVEQKKPCSRDSVPGGVTWSSAYERGYGAAILSAVHTVESATDIACDLAQAWLRALPAWETHPMTANGSVSGHRGPTLVSEADCVLHFARFLNQAGIPWEDMHLELSRVQSMFAVTHPTFVNAYKWRVDLAVVPRDALAAAAPPFADDSFRFDAFYEFKLASAFWLHGKPFGHPAKLRENVDRDVDKVGRYVELGLCHRAYVIVFEECDHGFGEVGAGADSPALPGVGVHVIRGWG